MKNRFYLTEAETSEKIVKSDRLEEIRRTVIASIITDFPGELLCMCAEVVRPA